MPNFKREPVKLDEETLNKMGFDTSKMLKGDGTFESLTFNWDEEGKLQIECLVRPSGGALREHTEHRSVEMTTEIYERIRRAFKHFGLDPGELAYLDASKVPPPDLE